MAQTANATSFKDNRVEYSTDGSTTWTDCSGFANEVTVSGGERKSGEAYTFDGDTAVLGKGKRAPLTVSATFLYTETTSEPFGVLMPYYEAGSALALRWCPKGLVAGTGELLFTTGFTSSFIKLLGYPVGNADSGDPLVIKLDLLTPSVTRGTATT
jgi:hypothetical protein